MLGLYSLNLRGEVFKYSPELTRKGFKDQPEAISYLASL